MGCSVTFETIENSTETLDYYLISQRTYDYRSR
jgi:hypothetical protein